MPEELEPTIERMFSRRDFFERAGSGMAGMALASLLGNELSAATADKRGTTPPHTDLAARQPHLVPRAKCVIHLFMNGGPSQMDLFDPKPELTRRHGEAYFDRIAGEVENPDQAAR